MIYEDCLVSRTKQLFVDPITFTIIKRVYWKKYYIYLSLARSRQDKGQVK